MTTDESTRKTASLPAPASPWRFSLAELMGVVTMVAFCCGLWSMHPVTGFFTLVLVLPSSLLFTRALRFCRKMGVPLTASEYAWSFSYSCLVGILAAAAYFMAMLSVFFVIVVFLRAQVYYALPAPIVILIAAIACLPIPLGILVRFRLRPKLRALIEQ